MDMEKKDTMGRAAIVSLFDEGTFVEMVRLSAGRERRMTLCFAATEQSAAS